MMGKPISAVNGVQDTFISRMKAGKKRVVVFYGSQTGTAEEFAARLAKDSSRHGMPAFTYDPEDCSDWVRIHTIPSSSSSFSSSSSLIYILTM